MEVALRMLAVGVEPLRHNQVQIVLGAGVPVANLISLAVDRESGDALAG